MFRRTVLRGAVFAPWLLSLAHADARASACDGGWTPARRGPHPDMLKAIATWIERNTDLEPLRGLPAVEIMSADRAAAVRQGATTARGREVVAQYDDASRTIFLSAQWTGATMADLSVLVHEMVHHLQNEAGQGFACPEAREDAALDAQEKWLAMFGGSLERDFGIDPFTRLARGLCIR